MYTQMNKNDLHINSITIKFINCPSTFMYVFHSNCMPFTLALRSCYSVVTENVICWGIWLSSDKNSRKIVTIKRNQTIKFWKFYRLLPSYTVTCMVKFSRSIHFFGFGYKSSFYTYENSRFVEPNMFELFPET